LSFVIAPLRGVPRAINLAHPTGADGETIS
jgi:hypothetical protein